MVSIPACHAGDRGSIPRRGVLLYRICLRAGSESILRFEVKAVQDRWVEVYPSIFVSSGLRFLFTPGFLAPKSNFDQISSMVYTTLVMFRTTVG